MSPYEIGTNCWIWPRSSNMNQLLILLLVSCLKDVQKQVPFGCSGEISDSLLAWATYSCSNPINHLIQCPHDASLCPFNSCKKWAANSNSAIEFQQKSIYATHNQKNGCSVFVYLCIQIACQIFLDLSEIFLSILAFHCCDSLFNGSDCIKPLTVQK